MTLEKNDILETTIEGLGNNGEGIAKIDGLTVFIPYALPGERITIKIVAMKKTHAFGKLIRILAPADERAREECPAYIQCGGCQMQHMKYKDQLAFKTIVVSDTLKKVGKINYNVPVCVKSDARFAYRNKLQLPVGLYGKENSLLIGFYANNSHRIININGCPLHPDWNIKLIDIIKKFMSKYAVPGYNEITHAGVIRHLVARQVGKILQITIVINSNTLKDSDILVSKLREVFNECSVFLNINKQDTNVVLSDHFIKLCGEDELETTDMGLKIGISPDSFMQVNNNVKTKLYTKALDISEVTENDIVIDAYSGIGILSSLFAQKADHVYAMEIVKNAVENAKQIMIKNELEGKITHVLGDCDVDLSKLITLATKKAKADTILILDPPRKGVSRKVIDAVLENPPTRILYISCNPATLSRDIGMLIGTIDMDEYKTDTPKFELAYLQPYDMFPQTKHVECLVMLKRKV